MEDKRTNSTLMEKEQASTLDYLSEIGTSSPEYKKGLEAVESLNKLMNDNRKIELDAERIERDSSIKREIELERIRKNHEAEMRKYDIEERKLKAEAELERERRIFEAEQAQKRDDLEREKIAAEKEMNESKIKADSENAKKRIWTDILVGVTGFAGTIGAAFMMKGVYDKALKREEDGVIPSRPLDVGSKFGSLLKMFK